MSNVKLGIGAKIWNTSTEEDVGNIIHDNFSEYTEKVIPNNDDVLVINDSEDTDVIKRVKMSNLLILNDTETITESTTLSQSMANKMILTNHDTVDIELIIPKNTTEPISVNSEFVIVQVNTANTQLQLAVDVTVNGSDDDELYQLNDIYEAVLLKKIDTDTWLLLGSYFEVV